jgi:hypothetical protein
MSKINNKKYWQEFYKKKLTDKPSSWAVEVAPFLKGTTVELGSGNGRDLKYFHSLGLKAEGIDEITGITAEMYMASIKSPKNVYTRFYQPKTTVDDSKVDKGEYLH